MRQYHEGSLFLFLLSYDDKFHHWGCNIECVYLTGISDITSITQRIGEFLTVLIFKYGKCTEE